MMQEKKSPVLEMRGITKRFPGVTANDHIDLALYTGEVLALLGENGAGKSSLMNVLAGLYRPDAGTIHVRGEQVDIRSPQDAAKHGIGMIHQEFALVQTMSVAENIILGMRDLPFVLPVQTVRTRIQELSKRYGLMVDPDRYVCNLSVGEQQRVEILKLVYRGADVLILDEPTAVLTPQEAQELNSILKVMLSEGKSAIFITHKMEEVLSFSQRVQVLRQGKTVAHRQTAETAPPELAQMMVGREVLFRVEKQPVSLGREKLTLDTVTVKDRAGQIRLDDVSLCIHAGEILGIAGVAGNGQQELAETVTGLLPVTSGSIHVDGNKMTGSTPLQMIRSGVSHIPADRGAMGIVGDMSVAENLVMKRFRNRPFTDRLGMIHESSILRYAKKMIKSFVITTPSPHTRAKFLSGGNIQKTILAREIDACKGVLVAAYPSRGLDVGAAEAVRKHLLDQRNKGAAILLISEELDELISLADRVAVMYRGSIMGTENSQHADKQRLGLLMAGVADRSRGI